MDHVRISLLLGLSGSERQQAGLIRVTKNAQRIFRGVDLDALLDMSTDELVKLFPARARRRFQRGLKRKPMALIKKLRKAEIYEGCLMLFLIRSLEANQFSGPIPPQLGDLVALLQSVNWEFASDLYFTKKSN
ncbi:hypothetical protein GQ457_06G014740 [Hibiscus cannabinus]